MADRSSSWDVKELERNITEKRVHNRGPRFHDLMRARNKIFIVLVSSAIILCGYYLKVKYDLGTNDKEVTKNELNVFMAKITQYIKHNGCLQLQSDKDENIFPKLFEILRGDLKIRWRIVVYKFTGETREANDNEIGDKNIPKYYSDYFGSPYICRIYKSARGFIVCLYSVGRNGRDERMKNDSDDIGVCENFNQ